MLTNCIILFSQTLASCSIGMHTKRWFYFERWLKNNNSDAVSTVVSSLSSTEWIHLVWIPYCLILHFLQMLLWEPLFFSMSWAAGSVNQGGNKRRRHGGYDLSLYSVNWGLGLPMILLCVYRPQIKMSIQNRLLCRSSVISVYRLSRNCFGKCSFFPQ